MRSESETSVRLQIGHVLFMDLVGYSKLLLDEQRQYHEQLTEIVLDTEQVRGAKEAGKLIRLPVGDGMALVFFNSPEAPVRCAIEIREAKEYPQLKLRMGIHSGPINEVRDVNDQQTLQELGSILRSGSWIAETKDTFCCPRGSRKIWPTRDSGVHICMTWGNAP